MQILLYSVLGAFIYLLCWAVPAHFIAKPVPRLLCQLFVAITAAFLLPAPNDPKVAFMSGQYAFGGGVILIGLWALIQKARGR